MSYALTWEKSGVYKKFRGQISFQEYAKSQAQVLSDPRADEIRYILNDLLEMTGYTVTREEAEESAAFNRASALSNPHVRVAYVTTDVKLRLLLKLAGVFSAYEIRAFNSLDEARRWAMPGSD